MKYTSALLPPLLSALTSPVAATTLFDCPHSSLVQDSIGLSFDVNVDTSNCNTEDIDSTKSAIAEFIQISVTEVSGYISDLGEVEIDLEEGNLCEEVGRRTLLRLRSTG